MIGNKIKQLRKNADMTQARLAKLLCVSTAAVGFWEIGKRQPDNETLKLLSKIFNVSIDFLLNNETNNTITILGSNGSYQQFELSDKNLKAIELLAKSLSENDI